MKTTTAPVEETATGRTGNYTTGSRLRGDDRTESRFMTRRNLSTPPLSNRRAPTGLASPRLPAGRLYARKPSSEPLSYRGGSKQLRGHNLRCGVDTGAGQCEQASAVNRVVRSAIVVNRKRRRTIDVRFLRRAEKETD